MSEGIDWGSQRQLIDDLSGLRERIDKHFGRKITHWKGFATEMYALHLERENAELQKDNISLRLALGQADQRYNKMLEDAGGRVDRAESTLRRVREWCCAKLTPANDKIAINQSWVRKHIMSILDDAGDAEADISHITSITEKDKRRYEKLRDAGACGDICDMIPDGSGGTVILKDGDEFTMADGRKGRVVLSSDDSEDEKTDPNDSRDDRPVYSEPDASPHLDLRRHLRERDDVCGAAYHYYNTGRMSPAAYVAVCRAAGSPILRGSPPNTYDRLKADAEKWRAFDASMKEGDGHFELSITKYNQLVTNSNVGFSFIGHMNQLCKKWKRFDLEDLPFLVLAILKRKAAKYEEIKRVRKQFNETDFDTKNFYEDVCDIINRDEGGDESPA